MRLGVGVCWIVLGQAAVSMAADKWTISVGPEARLGMKVRATGSSFVQALDLSSTKDGRVIPPSRDFTPADRYAPGPRDAKGYADRTFDDGYVKMDDGTDYPDSVMPGMTWYWGYENPAQYDAERGVLRFHRVITDRDTQSIRDIQEGRDVTRALLRNERLTETENQNAAGLGLAVGRSIASAAGIEVEMRGGLGVLWGDERRLNASTYSEQIRMKTFRVEDQHQYVDQHTYRDTYTYNTADVMPPAAPYEGTHDGPGPVIPNTPTSTRRDVKSSTRQETVVRTVNAIGSTDWTALNQIDYSVDSELYDIWMGPRVRVRPYRSISLVADTRVSMNYVDVQVSRTERFLTDRSDGNGSLLQEWRNEVSRAEWILGFGFSLGVDVDVTAHWRIGLQGGYDWMCQDVDLEAGPSSVSLDPSGYVLGAAATRVF